MSGLVQRIDKISAELNKLRSDVIEYAADETAYSEGLVRRYNKMTLELNARIKELEAGTPECRHRYPPPNGQGFAPDRCLKCNAIITIEPDREYPYDGVDVYGHE